MTKQRNKKQPPSPPEQGDVSRLRRRDARPASALSTAEANGTFATTKLYGSGRTLDPDRGPALLPRAGQFPPLFEANLSQMDGSYALRVEPTVSRVGYLHPLRVPFQSLTDAAHFSIGPTTADAMQRLDQAVELAETLQASGQLEPFYHSRSIMGRGGSAAVYTGAYNHSDKVRMPYQVPWGADLKQRPAGVPAILRSALAEIAAADDDAKQAAIRMTSASKDRSGL